MAVALTYSKVRTLLKADLAWAKKHRRPLVVKRVKEMLAKLAVKKT